MATAEREVLWNVTIVLSDSRELSLTKATAYESRFNNGVGPSKFRDTATPML